MSKSKHRKNHETKLKTFKNKQKQQKMSTQQNAIPNLPPVRNIPVWSSDAVIQLTGFEWEAIQNGLIQVQIMQQAAQSVMTRNIMNGTIKMDFEKLNPQTLQYEPMTDEEKAPHIAEFTKLIESLKAGANQQTEPQSNIETVPTIVSPSGEAISSDDLQENTGAKIITLGE